MNFFQLINEIDVNEGTKVKFRDTVYTYGIWNNTHAYWFITEDKGVTVPPRASEQGWELVKHESKKVSGLDALVELMDGKSLRCENKDIISINEVVCFLGNTEFEVVG